jgi:hypothetical protein
MARDCVLQFNRLGSSGMVVPADGESIPPEFVPEMCRWFKAAGIDVVAHFKLRNESIILTADDLPAGVSGVVVPPEGLMATFSDEFLVDIDGRREIHGRRAGDF